jgi:hypothetical protein
MIAIRPMGLWTGIKAQANILAHLRTLPAWSSLNFKGATGHPDYRFKF